MRLAYLNADPGVPLLGPKGASVHVRETLRALAPRVDTLQAVTARLLPRRERDRVAVPAGTAPPCAVVELGVEAEAKDPLGLTVNDAAERALRSLRRTPGIDAIYERYSLWSVAGAEAARRWGIPWILEVNAPLVDETARHRGMTLRSAAGFLERRLFEEATAIVAVSDEVRAHVLRRGADPRSVTVLPNGYRGSLFRRARVRPAVERPFTVIFVGSLKPWHGLDVLVEAFERFLSSGGDGRLVMVGDGPLRAELQARVRGALTESALRFVGAVPHERIPRWLAEADVAVAPYPTLPRFYFSPLKIIEYCAMGVPVVASRIGQIADLLTDGENALLVEPGCPVSLAAALGRLHADAGLRQRLGRNALRVARGRTWEDTADRLLELFRVEPRAEPAEREAHA